MTLADLSNLPPITEQRGADPSLLHGELLAVVADTIAAHPRSQQKRIGPSEIGCPCPRRIAYKLAGVEPVNGKAGWRPTVGTAVHSWLEDAFRENNRQWREASGQNVTRWLLEFKVEVGQVGDETITGQCDIYDRVTATSIDWKVVGPDALKRYKANGPGQQYRTQAQLYGRGWASRGLPIDTVGICFLPSNGELRDSVWWSQPYDEQVATDALSRLAGIRSLVDAAGPTAAAALPTAEAYCSHCPFYLPAATELTEACPGHQATTAATTRPTAA